MSARKPSSVPEPILVLDLGSATLRVALVVDGRPQVIAFPADGGRIPTVLGFDTSRINSAQDLLVLGDAARRLTITEPRTQLHGALRLAGRRHELVGLDDEHWRQVPVVRGPGADVHAVLSDGTWPVPRVLGALIQSVVERVERERSLKLERAVVSIAPGSDDARRRAVLQALRVAGFEQVELVHSTTAAALAWSTLERLGTTGLGIAGLEAALAASGKLVTLAPIEDEPELDNDDDDDEDDAPDQAKSESEPAVESESDQAEDELDEESDSDELESGKPREQLVLLLDLGAGSFSAALARLEDANIEMLAARSRMDLGGDEIDERIVDWLLGQFEDANEVDLSGDATVRARMRDVAEKAKLALSDADRYEVRLPFLWADASGPKHLFVTLERERFERMIHDVVEATSALARAVLDDAGHGADELDAVVMLGGCARVPILQDRIEGLLGRVPETELSVASLDEDFVVRGLALEAARRSHRRPPSAVVEIAGRELWLRTSSGISRVVERSDARPLQRTIALPVEAKDVQRHFEFELFEGDDDDRVRTLRGQIDGEARKASLRVAVDADGCIAVHVEPSTLSLVVSQRVGLSARALERLRREASERARAAAARHRHEELRRRLWTLARTVEAWLGETEGKPLLDELLRTSLTQWRRDAEVALERGDEALLGAGLEAFAALRDALPTKLRNQLEDETFKLGGPTDAAAAELEPLGDPSTDYDANEQVDLLELELEKPADEEVEAEEAAEELENATDGESAADVVVSDEPEVEEEVAAAEEEEVAAAEEEEVAAAGEEEVAAAEEEVAAAEEEVAAAEEEVAAAEEEVAAAEEEVAAEEEEVTAEEEEVVAAEKEVAAAEEEETEEEVAAVEEEVAAVAEEVAAVEEEVAAAEEEVAAVEEEVAAVEEEVAAAEEESEERESAQDAEAAAEAEPISTAPNILSTIELEEAPEASGEDPKNDESESAAE